MSTRHGHELIHRLPNIIKDIKKLHDALAKELETLGDGPSADPCSEMLGLVRTYSDAVGAWVEAEPDKEYFYRAVKCEYATFKKQVWSTAPRLVPFNKKGVGHGQDCEATASDEHDDGGKEEDEIEELQEPRLGRSGHNSAQWDLDDVRGQIEK